MEATLTATAILYLEQDYPFIIDLNCFPSRMAATKKAREPSLFNP